MFSEEQEQLCDHILELLSRMFELSITDPRQLAFQFAEKNATPHPFNMESEVAGSPENPWVSRGYECRTDNMFHPCKRQSFFYNFEAVIDKYKVGPSRMHN